MEKMKKRARCFISWLICMAMAAAPITAFADTQEDGNVIKNVEVINATLSYQDGDVPKATAAVSDSTAHYEVDYENWQRMEEQEDGSWKSVEAWYSDPDTLSVFQDDEKITSFEMGKYYIYNIQLNAKDGYIFSSESDLKISLNGKELIAGSGFVQDNGSKLHLAWAAELGSKWPVTGDVYINDAIFDYNPGDAPKAAAYKLDPEAGYDIAYEYWEEMEAKPDGTSEPVAFWYSDEAKNNALSADKKITVFEEGKTYMYSISLKAKDLCSFSDNCSVVVNNMKVDARNVRNSKTGLFVVAVKTIKPTEQTEPICANGHKPQKAVTQATIKNDGKIVTSCSVCGKTLSTEIIPKASDIRLSAVSYTYNGKTKKPSVTVNDRTGKKISAVNYTVSYAKGRKNVGVYDVVITFKGDYQGKITKSFTIKPQSISIGKVSAGKKKITVKWKKQTKQISGYEIQYSTDKKFKKNTRSAVSASKTSSKTITKLKPKKNYYVRIRSYKTVKVKGKNTKIYSSWSKGKSAKVKN